MKQTCCSKGYPNSHINAQFTPSCGMSFCVRLSQASCTCCRNSAIWTGSLCRLQEARWTYQRIASHIWHNVSWVCRCFQNGLWNITTPVDQVLDGRIVQTHFKIDAVWEQRWPHPMKKFGYMLHLLYHEGLLGTVCLQQDSNHMCLWPGYHLHHDTEKNDYSGVVNCRLESGMALCCLHWWESVCEWWTYTRVRRTPGERHLPECIRSWHTGPTSGFMMWGQELQLAVTFGVSAGQSKQCPLHWTSC